SAPFTQRRARPTNVSEFQPPNASAPPVKGVLRITPNARKQKNRDAREIQDLFRNALNSIGYIA
ncbi:hypothetical protein KM176_20910, partial [Pseudooceanicola sp. CBS1P-1]|uniref:hypothetical protein n=1 Tax=Pseudooceanicola endophyticus TaxID=2841273 RepID=UPI001C00C4FE